MTIKISKLVDLVPWCRTPLDLPLNKVVETMELEMLLLKKRIPPFEK